MFLTPLGANVLQRGEQQQREVAMKLIHPTKYDNITTYLAAGVCYDTVALTRYLLGSKFISLGDVLSKTGNSWSGLFNSGVLWQGRAIAAGTAVLFRRPARDPRNNKDVPRHGPFHVAIALGGGTTVRSVNGLMLGAGWGIADSNIAVNTGQLKPIDNSQTVFQYGGDQEICEVLLSKL